MEKLKSAIDLLWVRPNKVGGIESVARNLLDGFALLEDEFEFWLLVSKDNATTFEHYAQDDRFHIEKCEIESANVKKRIIWQNLYLGKRIRDLGLNKCLEPYYCKPIIGTQGIEFVTIIHDLQAIHYPEYFSKGKELWMRIAWRCAIKSSKRIVAVSDFVKRDIIDNYKSNQDKIKTIYNPVVVDCDNVADICVLKEKYGVNPGDYYFTVSSLLPHKNIGVLLNIIHEIVEKKIDLPSFLIVSGVGGKSRGELEKKIKELNLSKKIQLTEFINDDERNALYKNCYAFLFPSIFEGFGMPPIEAMMFGVPVVTTRMTSIEEVTQGKANYVDNPRNPEEWIETIRTCKHQMIDFEKYGIKRIAKEYLEIMK